MPRFARMSIGDLSQALDSQTFRGARKARGRRTSLKGGYSASVRVCECSKFAYFSLCWRSRSSRTARFEIRILFVVLEERASLKGRHGARLRALEICLFVVLEQMRSTSSRTARFAGGRPRRTECAPLRALDWRFCVCALSIPQQWTKFRDSFESAVH